MTEQMRALMPPEPSPTASGRERDAELDRRVGWMLRGHYLRASHAPDRCTICRFYEQTRDAAVADWKDGTMSALTPPRTHSVVLTHEEFRAILIAIDQSVYPGHDGTPIGVELYKQLTVLHERLWEEFTKR